MTRHVDPVRLKWHPAPHVPPIGGARKKHSSAPSRCNSRLALFAAKLLLHVVDASNPQAEEHIRAVNAVLKELECGDKPTILVLNKLDRVTDPTVLQVLQAKHPRSVAVSGLTGAGVDLLEEAVMASLAAEFAEAEVVTDAGNGRVLAFLNANAEVYRQEFKDDSNEVVVRCHLPRHLLHHIAGPTIRVRFLERNGPVHRLTGARRQAARRGGIGFRLTNRTKPPAGLPEGGVVTIASAHAIQRSSLYCK